MNTLDVSPARLPLKLSALEFLFQTQLMSPWPTAVLMKLLNLQAFEACMD